MRANRIIVLPEAISHPSPRLVDAIEELARALYPERFGAKGAALAGTAGTRGMHAGTFAFAAVCAQASVCDFVGCDLGRGWL